MISCNELTVSSCSISCPNSVWRTFLWYWLIALNQILYYVMKSLADWHIELYGAVTLWRAHDIHLLVCEEWDYCTQKPTFGSFTHYLYYFQWTLTRGCQQFTVIYILYVYKILLPDVTLLVLLLQYVTRHKELSDRRNFFIVLRSIRGTTPFLLCPRCREWEWS